MAHDMAQEETWDGNSHMTCRPLPYHSPPRSRFAPGEGGYHRCTLFTLNFLLSFNGISVAALLMQNPSLSHAVSD